MSQNRPAPRKSSLSSSSPITPPSLEVEGETSTVPNEGAKAKRDGEKRTAKYPHKVSFYQDATQTDRVRGAILYTMASEGPRSLSSFINNAVMTEVQRLEDKYNHGDPFPPVGARQLPQGRQL